MALAGYSNSLELTIDSSKVDSNLTNFPVLIVLSSGTGINSFDATHVFDTVTSGSKQIAVTDSSYNQLYVEIENWDYQNEEAYLWVKIPTVSSDTDTTLYLYYDSTQPDNTTYVGDTGSTAAQNVWTNGFSRVYHLNGDPASGVIDSVGNGNGTAGGSLNSSDVVSAKIGNGYDFDRSTSDRFVVTDGTDLDLNTWQVELIYNPDDVSNNQNLIEKRQSGQNDYYTNFVIQDRETDGQILVFFGWATNYAIDNPTYSFSTGINYHIVGRYDGSTINTFVNGVKQGSGQSTSQTPHQSGSDVTWVGGSSQFGNYTDGIIDEVRIQTDRSDAWVKATYYSSWNNLVSYSLPVTAWANRLDIVIDHTKIDEDLTDFPVLITLTSGTGTNSFDATHVFDTVTSGSKQIAVTDSSYNQLYVEIESWDWANEQAYLWAKVPTVSSGTDTTLYLYYDSTQPDNTTYVGDTGDTPAQNVWDSNFVAVYHMAQDPNGDAANSIKDSTSGGNDGTPQGSMTSDDLVDGKVGKGLDFDGSDDIIGVPDINVGTNGITLEIITKANAAGWDRFLWVDYSNGVHHGGGIAEDAGNYVFVWQGSDGSRTDSDNQTTATSITTADYVYVAGSWDGSGDDGKIYVDGTDDSNGTSSSWSSWSTEGNISIGGQVDKSGKEVDGIIDEVRLSNTNRSASWIKATYYSNWDSLISFTEEQPPGPTTTFPQIFVGGQWVNVNGVWIYINGQWRTVNEMKIYIQDAWRSLV